jgi:hypothetical protein
LLTEANRTFIISYNSGNRKLPKLYVKAKRFWSRLRVLLEHVDGGVAEYLRKLLNASRTLFERGWTGAGGVLAEHTSRRMSWL